MTAIFLSEAAFAAISLYVGFMGLRLQDLLREYESIKNYYSDCLIVFCFTLLFINKVCFCVEEVINMMVIMYGYDCPVGVQSFLAILRVIDWLVWPFCFQFFFLGLM